MKPRTLQSRLAIGYFMIAALLVVLAVTSLLNSRARFTERAELTAENLAATLELTLQSEVSKVDTALQGVIQSLEHERANHAAHPDSTDGILGRWIGLVPFMESLRVSDARGQVRFSTSPLPAGGVNLGDRDYFVKLRNDPDAGLVISEALQSRITGRWVVVFARRLPGPNGAFAGVVHAAVSVERFQSILAAVQVGAKGAVTLRSDQLGLIARYSPGQDAGPSVGSRSTSQQLKDMLRVQPDKGRYLATTALDHIERINAYHRVGHWPLVVLVGFETQDYYAPWRTQARQIVALGLVSLVLLALATRYVYRAWVRVNEKSLELARESDKRRALLLAATDGIHIVDRAGVLIECSHSFATMLGYGRDELLGRHVADWDAHGERASIERWIGGVTVGTHHRFETVHRRSDGSTFDVEVQCVGVTIDSVDVIYCASRDISERKRLQKQLEAASDDIRDLYDNAPCGYHSLDPHGRFLHVNATELRWLGYSRDEVVGKMTITDIFTESGKARFRERFPQLMAHGSVDGLEFDLVGRDGQIRRVILSASAVKDPEGRFLHSRSVFHDITDLKRARDALRQLMATQQAMLDNELIGMVKTAGRSIVWKNHAMNRIFGYVGDELTGQSPRVLYPSEEAFGAEGAAAYPVLAQGGRYRSQVQMVRKDGERIWVDANGVLLSGEADEVLWMLVDITSIKEAQAEVEHMAFHDGLTGLPNRALFADRLQQAVVRARRQGRQLAVCYLDLDGFKQVNDQYGHAAGDELLRTIARRVQGALRADDTVCRMGGDEFVLLMTHVEQRADIQAVLERVASEVAEDVVLDAIRRVKVSASMGVAMYPEHGGDPQALMRRADEAMYAAKQAGKNQIRWFDPLRKALTSDTH